MENVIPVFKNMIFLSVSAHECLLITVQTHFKINGYVSLALLKFLFLAAKSYFFPYIFLCREICRRIMNAWQNPASIFRNVLQCC